MPRSASGTPNRAVTRITAPWRGDLLNALSGRGNRLIARPLLHLVDFPDCSAPFSLDFANVWQFAVVMLGRALPVLLRHAPQL
jgi:hypothetical protein